MKNLSLDEVLEHPIVNALNPKGKHFMKVRWLSPRLNRFAEYDIRMAALIPFGTFPHIKSIPAFQMLLEDFNAGRYKKKHTIVVDSSGNTAHAVALLAPAFGFDAVKIVLSSDVPQSKVGILDALSSVEVIKVPTGVAKRAHEEGNRPGHIHLNQYAHLGNMKSHSLYTGVEIDRVIPELSVLTIPMGSCGTVAGVGSFYKEQSQHNGIEKKIKIIGVRPYSGQQVPGARNKERMEEVVTLPWERYVDSISEVGRKSSFSSARLLWSEVVPQPGPTSGMAYYGLLKFLSALPLKSLASLTGSSVAFLCPDDGRFYTERFTGELDEKNGIFLSLN